MTGFAVTNRRHARGAAGQLRSRQRRGQRIALLLMLFCALACSTAKAQQVVKIGVIGPLTGTGSAMGESQLTGAEMRAREINAAGKLKIELLAEDDASKCDQSANAAVKLITQQQVTAVIGAVNSPCALALVPLTKRYKVPQFTIGVGTAITQQGSDWIFRMAVAAPGQTKALADYAINVLKLTKIAMIYSDDEYGASMAAGFEAALTSLNVPLLAAETYPRGDQDFTGQLTKVRESGATALYTTGAFTSSALIARQAKQLGMEFQLLGDSANSVPRYIELGGEAVEGAVMVEPFSPSDPDPKIQDFGAKYRDHYKRDVDGWVAAMYDTVGMIEAAVAKTGKTDPASIREYLAGLSAQRPYEGILGAWYFDKMGDANFPLYKVQIRNGKTVILAH